MSEVAIFHSVLGVRPGVLDAAERLRAAGHLPIVVDTYAGRTFDDYESASAFTEQLGFPELMRRALAGAADLSAACVALGFSNGAGMAAYVATQRPVGGVVMVSGALPLEAIGAEAWPSGVPVQVHYSVDDRFRRDQMIDSIADSVTSAHAHFESFDYPGNGHLFTDPSLPDEYDLGSTEALWKKVIDFCAAPPNGGSQPGSSLG